MKVGLLSLLAATLPGPVWAQLQDSSNIRAAAKRALADESEKSRSSESADIADITENDSNDGNDSVYVDHPHVKCTGGNNFPHLDLSRPYQPLMEPNQIYPDYDGVTRIDLVYDIARYIGPSYNTILRLYHDGLNPPVGPGPTIHVKPGGRLEVYLANCLMDPPGLEEHNKYQHPNSTNLHTHGPHISGNLPGDYVLLSVEPGEGHQYYYVFDEAHMPGTFWYHPHDHGSTSLQTGQGGAGLLIVDEPEDYDIPVPIKAMPEIQMLFQHIDVGLLRDIAKISEDQVTNWDDLNFEFTNVTTDLNDFFLVNMQFLPVVTMQQGKWYRWRIGLSSIKTGFAFVSASGNCEFQVLSKDGIFLTDAPREVEAVILSAGNRADVAVRCSEVGQEYINSTYIWLDPDFGLFDPADQNISYTVEYPPVSTRVGDFADPEAQPTFFVVDVIENTGCDYLSWFQCGGCCQWHYLEGECHPADGQTCDDDLETFNTPTPCYLVDLQDVETDPADMFINDYGCINPGQATPFDISGQGLGWPVTPTPEDTCGVAGPIGQGGIFIHGAPFIPFPMGGEPYMKSFPAGSVQEILLVGNQFHPYHQHVNPFQIIEINTEKINQTLQPIVTNWYQEGDWQDTLQYPAAIDDPASPLYKNAEFNVRMRFQADTFTGHMIQHCHLLFHEDTGMMAQYDITGDDYAQWEGAKEIDPQCIEFKGTSPTCCTWDYKTCGSSDWCNESKENCDQCANGHWAEPEDYDDCIPLFGECTSDPSGCCNPLGTVLCTEGEEYRQCVDTYEWPCAQWQD